jgi:hypothetical protein
VYGVQTKMKSSQWTGKWSPGPKKALMSRLKINGILVVIFDWKGIFHHKFLPRGQMVNRKFYQEVSARVKDAVRRMRLELWEK